MHLSALNGNTDVLMALISRNGDVNAKNSNYLSILLVFLYEFLDTCSLCCPVISIVSA